MPALGDEAVKSLPQSYEAVPAMRVTTDVPVVYGTRDVAILESCALAKKTGRTLEVSDRGVVPAKVIGKAHGGSGRWEWVK